MGFIEHLKLKITYGWICTTCVVMTGLAVLLAILTPATGYEVSIYTSTPLAFWVLVILSISLCVGLLINEAMRGTGMRWLFVFGVLMLNGIAVLELSVLRNYYTVGETLMHIGYVKDMAEGIRSTMNVYPGLHVISTVLTFFGLSAKSATNLMPIVCYGIYVGGFYGLASTIWTDRRYIIIGTTLSAMLMLPMGVGLVGTLIAGASFPLFLLLLLKMWRKFNVQHILPLLLLMVALAFLHPLALEATCIALAVACLIPAPNRWKMVALAVVLIPVSLFWLNFWFHIYGHDVLQMDLLEGFFKTVVGSVSKTPVVPPVVLAPPTETIVPSLPFAVPPALLAGERTLPFLPPMEGIEATRLVGNISGVGLLFSRYGCEILLGCLAIVSFFVMVKGYVKRTCRNERNLYFGGLLAVFGLMVLTGWYLSLNSFELALSRMLFWMPPLSIILATPLLVRWIASKKWRRLPMVLAVAVMLVVANSGLFHMYNSAIVGIPNLQVTQQEIDGIDWLMEKGISHVNIVHLNMQRVSRFVAEKYGVEWTRLHQTDYWSYESRLPKVFSYNDKPSIGWGYPQDIYLIVIKMDKLLPRWDADKLYLIESDTSATLVYEDGDEFVVYYVVSYSNRTKGM